MRRVESARAACYFQMARRLQIARRWIYAVLMVVCIVIPGADALADTLSGQVFDAQTRAPIPGALVKFQAESTRSIAGPDGTFSLQGGAPGVRVTAAAKGYFTVGVDWPENGRVDFELEPVPSHPNTPMELIDPSACQGCHPNQVAEWKTSGMAHAGKNQWVEDLYLGSATPGGQQGFVYTRDSVHARRDPESDCAACHQPEAWIDDPFTAYRPAADAHPAAQRGVSCITCHMMADVDETRPNFPGIYPGVVEMTRGSVVRYGVLGDVDYHAVGRMRASYQPQLTAAACATCHQDSNDPSGSKKFDGPISEPTYLEWLNSPYGDPENPLFQTCMDCHSTPTGAPSASNLQVTVPRPAGQIRSHDFPGTTPEFLQKAMRLDAAATDSTLENERIIQVRVELENIGAGHHVPTGVTIRNMILLVEAEDADGALDYLGDQFVGELGGKGDPSEGYFAEMPGKLFAKINRAASGQRAVLFTEAVDIVSDNRIAPLAVERLDFPFRVRSQDKISIRVRLIYRRAWRALIDAKNWRVDGRGRELDDLSPPHFGHLMAQKAFTHHINAGEGEPEGPDAGSGNDERPDAGSQTPTDPDDSRDPDVQPMPDREPILTGGGTCGGCASTNAPSASTSPTNTPSAKSLLSIICGFFIIFSSIRLLNGRRSGRRRS